MKSYHLTKDLIFYSPNKSDALFTYAAGTSINLDILQETKSFLENETSGEVKWVKDRRKSRPKASTYY